MATYHGEAFIDQQLASIDAQTVGPIDLHISDDSKKPGTVERAEKFVANRSNITLHVSKGPGTGFVDNFRSLILNVEPASNCITFSDQDDIWVADKTARSAQWLNSQPDNIPALYCGRTEIITADGKPTGRCSPHFARAPHFKNAIVQSIAGGNTMAMNRAAFDLLRRSLRRGSPVSHDWWTYIIVSGAGGNIKYDPKPLTLYRQHGGNLIGENRSSIAKLRRMRMVSNGTWQNWQDRHRVLLDDNRDELSAEALALLRQYKGVRSKHVIKRISSMVRSGVWRQTRSGTLSLYLAVALNKI